MSDKPNKPRSGNPASKLSSEDKRLWKHVTDQAAPLSGRDRLRSRADDLLGDDGPPTPRKGAPGPAAGPSGPRAQPRTSVAPGATRRLEAALTHGSRDGLDRRKADRFRRGKLPIEATLDLHGLRQSEAHGRLERFLADCQGAGKRCVLVVTGKGVHKDQGGVLRAAVPRWLNEAPNRARVLSFDYAQQKHGGTGALYVLLRKRR